MSSDKEPNLSDKVDILSTDDEKLKSVGEILSSDSSRKILKLLFNQSLTANEIAQKTDLSLPLVIHHLKKMQSVQVVKITKVGKNIKAHDMKYYTIDKFAIVILPTEMSETAKKSKSLFNSLTRIHRLATLGGVSIAAWFSSQFIQKNQIIVSEVSQAPTADTMISESEDPMISSIPEQALEEMKQSVTVTAEPEIDILWSVIAVMTVIVTGLIIEIIIKQRKHSLSRPT